MTTSRAQRQARNQKIIEEIAAGTRTYEEIARDHGLTRGRIDQILSSEPGGEAARQQHKQAKHQGKLDVLRKAIDEKLTYREIAEKYGKDQSYWRMWADKLDMADQIYTAAKKNADKREKILAFLAEGHTQKEAAEKFGTTQVNISAIAVRNGVRRRFTGQDLVERNSRIVQDLKDGMTYAQASEKYGLSYASIYNASRFGGNVSTRNPDEIRERNEKIAKLLEDGLSPTEIAEEHGFSIYVAYNVAKELGYHTSKKRITGAEKSRRDREIIAKYEQGASARQLAEEYGLSVHTIYGLTSMAGVHHMNVDSEAAAARKERDEKVVASYKAGTTYEKIAAEHGISISSVYQILRRSGALGQR